MTNGLVQGLGGFTASLQGRLPQFLEQQQLQQEQERQRQAQQQQAGLIQQLGQFQPGQATQSDQFAQLVRQDPKLAALIGGGLEGISSERQAAKEQDAQRARIMLEKGNVEGALRLANNRIKDVQALGGDPKDTIRIRDFILAGDEDQALQELRITEQIAIANGRLGAIEQDVKRKFLKTENGLALFLNPNGTVSQEKIIGAIESGEKTLGKVLTNRKIEAETRKIIAETRKINRLSGIPPDSSELQAEKIAQVRSNVARTAELSSAAGTRDAARAKAQTFLTAFETGQASSGAGRVAASFIPGVFTSQGQFDEQLDAFAEQAARAQLKALGEIRPTDADVAGVKRSLFAIGRDEQTNITLLRDFVNTQNTLSVELEALREAKTQGRLDTFTGIPKPPKPPQPPNLQNMTPQDLQNLSDEDLQRLLGGQ